MSAMADTSTEWATEAIRLRRDEKMATGEIAERFGKSASQVRKVIAAASTERHVNGTGPMAERDEPEIVVNGETVGHGMEGMANALGALVPGLSQGDIEQALDNPEDPLHAFKREAGAPVGDMPPVTPPEPEATEVRYAGTRQTCLDFGPNADLPTGGTITIRSEKLASGHFGLGDLITGTFTARVTGMAPKEKFDSASEEFRAKATPYEATMTEVSFKAVDADR